MKILLAFVLILTQINLLAQTVIVQNKYGKIEGLSPENTGIYKGIPFAGPRLEIESYGKLGNIVDLKDTVVTAKL